MKLLLSLLLIDWFIVLIWALRILVPLVTLVVLVLGIRALVLINFPRKPKP
ncbi:hypothetical protein [Hymenobacter edaphi]|uniref:hypothetical protein n=1 Tax=Hymenobacter edaphi TaxID=2211146 RepID=UPI00140254DE|nr:hypothetical protein [Hymenobacter edaphi]